MTAAIIPLQVTPKIRNKISTSA